MKNLLKRFFIAVIFSFGMVAYSAEDTTPNLVRDGGIEQWNEVSPEIKYLGLSSVQWLQQFASWQLSSNEKGNLLIPSVYSQLAGKDGILKMETNDVFSGKHSLRLKGSTYLEKTSEDAYKTKSGDIYVVRYMAKGTGDTMMYFTVYGEGSYQILEKKGTPVADKWTLIEERLLVGGSAPTTIYPRIMASEEMLIDDVFVGRVLREDEKVGAATVPKKQE